MVLRRVLVSGHSGHSPWGKEGPQGRKGSVTPLHHVNVGPLTLASACDFDLQHGDLLASFNLSIEPQSPLSFSLIKPAIVLFNLSHIGFKGRHP